MLLLVVCDVVLLPFGKFRLRRGGGDGGHRGLESIIYHLSSEDFPRLRIGIGGGETPEQWVEQVLLPFTSDQEPEVSKVISLASEAVECWIREGVDVAMNRYNSVDVIDTPSESDQDKSVSPKDDSSE